MELNDVLLKRRSVRKFTEEPVSEEMREAYYEENFDKHRGYELDSELMSQMLEVYNSSIE